MDSKQQQKKEKEFVVQSFTIPANAYVFDAINCVDVTIFNYGTAILFVNDVIELTQNGTYVLSANAGETDQTKYRFRFAAVGTRKAILNVRKLLNQ